MPRESRASKQLKAELSAANARRLAANGVISIQNHLDMLPARMPLSATPEGRILRLEATVEAIFDLFSLFEAGETMPPEAVELIARVRREFRSL